MITPRVFRTRSFNRSTRKPALSDSALCRAVSEMRHGLIDADLGGGLFKKRVALPGRGKRGSARTIVATQLGRYWFLLFCYEKNERANLTKAERDALELYASEFLKMSSAQLDRAVMCGDLQEICHDQAC
ncbi:type II toxin-antitoxin system RelE/ParE family toxin [Stenotrophomonas sp. S48]|uniref:type II toxin-antitoxin system RelE/ParE family toxin n=1 Tax=unclassified Stenotrophomonas TaxID=196198 RepID=UPI0018FF18F9|nr:MULTISPECIES: type II toxin-antitoxin system RelE/ParE family toxin [unclassified Stenotrophomonas]MBK0025920.1 type II toxin-antitoxin system RelE/ParE family toxin [Stenotrophomonas sp. S48]MBK0047779.1 type II toxin-antitoxin system RelE/ParE family toxin [Stenotrophomonas sp. S49]